MKKRSSEKAKILIVDDTPENIQAAAAILSGQGYQLAFDEDGESALLHTKIVRFDLILLDIIMPGTDGFQICERLKDDSRTKNIPVIFLTAKTDTESIVRGFRIGAADYVTKPFEEAELLARVETHLELARHREHLENLVEERTQAIKVMLDIREEMMRENEKKIRANIFNRIFPMVETLRQTLKKRRQKECLTIIESGLGEILSEFSDKLASPRFDLSPSEVHIATLIREGRSTKQIADLLCVAENTVSFHRQNIRKKLGLIGKDIDLRTFLKSIE